MNLTDTIKTLKTDLDRVEDLVASGDNARADAVSKNGSYHKSASH